MVNTALMVILRQVRLVPPKAAKPASFFFQGVIDVHGAGPLHDRSGGPAIWHQSKPFGLSDRGWICTSAFRFGPWQEAFLDRRHFQAPRGAGEYRRDRASGRSHDAVPQRRNGRLNLKPKGVFIMVPVNPASVLSQRNIGSDSSMTANQEMECSAMTTAY